MNSAKVTVDADGITVLHREAATTSVFGTQTRPAREWSAELPWPEISTVRLYADEGRVLLDVDLVYGEFVTVDESADGFRDAVAAIAERGGVAAPDLGTVDDLVLFQA